ncbi:catalase family protein [Micromonospora rosaria]|uniref:phosphodiesterase n=1 Tax=Micromonospora rosaria TaxID=47874 RepID=UPI000832A5B4|nr:phosphodiesterase [Micromonospora rosaria]
MSLSSLVDRMAAVLARWRRARLLHPRGRSCTAEVVVWGTPGRPTGVGLVDRPGRYPALVRFSRGTPTPDGWPDVLGLAVRLYDADPAHPVDLLVSSSAAGPLRRHLPVPRRRFTGVYSTIMAYRAGRRRLWLAVLPDPASPDLGRSLADVDAALRTGTPRLRLAVASAVGPWRVFGEVRLGDPLDAGVDAATAFDPIGNLPAGLRATGPFARLRDRAYRGSRRARGATTRPDHPTGPPDPTRSDGPAQSGGPGRSNGPARSGGPGQSDGPAQSGGSTAVTV